MLKECFENVQKKTPLIHNITNYVTVNDVANVLLASGASPVMSDEPEDVIEITTICDGLHINIGTLNQRSMKAMDAAGGQARTLKHTVLLDPVGAGASALRTKTALYLMENVAPDVICGNISEIRALAVGTSTTKGVDADGDDVVTNDNLGDRIVFAKDFSAQTNAIVAITGAIDLITDGKRCFVVRNGRSEMGKITGTGCQLSGVMTAYVSANKENALEAAACSVCLMGLAGEIGYAHLQPFEGNATYRNRIIDAVYNMDVQTLEQGANYEIR